jgi:hypothetical protein
MNIGLVASKSLIQRDYTRHGRGSALAVSANGDEGVSRVVGDLIGDSIKWDFLPAPIASDLWVILEHYVAGWLSNGDRSVSFSCQDHYN